MEGTHPFVRSILALSLLLGIPLAAQTAEQVEFFEKRVRPVLVTRCQGCHNPKLKSSGLDLSSAAAFRQGGLSGPLIADKPEGSRLLQVVSYESPLKMPPTGKLKDEEIASLNEWVKLGAPWPGAEQQTAAAPAPKPAKEFTDAQKQFWAFQPVRPVTPPKVKDGKWVRTPVDRFILAALEARGLAPAAPADPYTLLRRVTFDLTGLPPTEAEMSDFLADSSPDAFEKVVDRLLASPRYGEQWGRHWLDVARYADSTGNDEDHRYPYAWQYRDYVIDTFNQRRALRPLRARADRGRPAARPTGSGPNRRGIVATGFLALGAKAIAQQDKKKMLYDIYDEQVDIISKAFLGLTLSCARCHDHKFDPLFTRDYYSLVSIFAATRNFEDAKVGVAKLLFVPLVPREEYRLYQQDREFHRIEETGDRRRLRRRARPLLQGSDAHLAGYMMAARRAGRRAAGLDARLLGKWVDLLEAGRKTTSVSGRVEQRAAGPGAGSGAGVSDALRGDAGGVEQDAGEVARALPQGDGFEEHAAAAHREFPESQDEFFRHVYFDKGPFAVEKEDREKYSPLLRARRSPR